MTGTVVLELISNIVIITFVIMIIIIIIIIILKKVYSQYSSYSMDAYLDNYDKRMSSLRQRILDDKYIDCYYHLLFIVIIVIT